MKLLSVNPNLKLKVAKWKPNQFEHQSFPVLVQIDTNRVIGIPMPGDKFPSPYTPSGGVKALEEILSSDGGFVAGTYLYGLPAKNISDDLYILEGYSLRAVKNLTCCCCGNEFRGRQWHNRDNGYGLGQCCIEYCKSNTPLPDFIQAYGVEGYNFNIAE